MTNVQINRPLPDLTDLPSPAPDSPVEALEWLGGTADEVAEGLRARGIKGRQMQADDCPLSRYLREWWEEASVWDVINTWGHEYHLGLPTPRPCFAFVQRFDLGDYPDLIA